MGRPSEQGKETEEKKLHQQFQHLQQQWDSIKHLKPRTLCRSSTDSRVMFKELHLLDNSPRNLMSSLQHRRSPLDGGGAWKVRYNDLAVEEILRDRKAAIESGKLKGRRLFEEEEGASEVGSGGKQDIISDNWNGFEEMSMFSYNSDDEKENVESKEEELYPVLCHYGSCSYSSSTSYICDDCIDEAVATEKKGVNIVAGYSNRLTKAKGWLAIILILCAICIISMKRLSGNGKVKEVILVPT